MFKFEATIEVSANYQLSCMFKALLTEQFSKRTENDFLISFDNGKLRVELCDVNFTEKLAPQLIGCGNIKEISIKNQVEAAEKSEPESEESEAEEAEESEPESEEPEAEAAEKSEPESEESEAEAAEKSEPESEEPEAEETEESEPESEGPEAEEAEESETKLEEVEAEAAEKSEPESEGPEAEVSEKSKPELIQELKSELEDSEKNVEDVITEELSTEYILKIYEEAGANTKKFCEMLADYIQIPNNIRIKKAFYELIDAVIETEKMSWFCIEKILKDKAKTFYEKPYYNNNTKVQISNSVKKKFNLTLLKFLKQIKDATKSIVKAEDSEKNAELSDTSIADANSKTANEKKNVETEAEFKQPLEKNIESEVKAEPELKENIKNEADLKPEFEETEKKAEVEIDAKVTNPNVEKNEDVFDEYWSGIFSCMPKIISTDTYRVNKASSKEKQFLAIDKAQPMSFRIKEVLEIMEDISLVADPNFITFSEKIFTKVPVIRVEKNMPLYEKTRLLQWSKMLQKFVQKYYTKDPNFRVKIDQFLTELREIIMTPEEINKIK